MKKLLSSALAICLIVIACSKSKAPTGFEDPVFMVTYEDSVTVTAGLDGIYHFTKLALGDDDVYTSISTFSDAGCPEGDCPGSLRFEFRRTAITDSLFSGGQYKYTLPDSLAPAPYAYAVELGWADIFNNFLNHKLLLVGNDSIVLTHPTMGNPIELPDIPHQAYLTSYGANGLTSVTHSTFLPSNQASTPKVSIRATGSGQNVSLTAFQDLSGSTVTRYFWNTGDTSAVVTVDSTQILPMYAVTVTDDLDNTASASLSALPFPLASQIRTPTVGITATPRLNPLQLLTVAIQWVDPDGSIWRSDLGAQQAGNSIFKVISSEHYEVNELGDPTLKLVVAFNCLLYTKEGAARWFEGQGIIAMARP